MEKEVLHQIVLSGIYFLQEESLLEELLEFQENINRKIDSLFKKENFACEKGCFFCCIGWEVKGIIPEVLLFIRELNALEEKKRVKIYEKLQEYKDIPNKENIPCPFLESGLCVAYSGRPFVCRTYSSYDKALCEKKETFQFPDIIGKALDIVKEEVSLVESPFNTLFETKIPLTQISFDKTNKYFYLNLGETAYIYPLKNKTNIQAGLYSQKYLR
ncbi:MAG: YkgJ family cysteine cluster protein [Aquificae bacterium]|nr:YkgJ family cysteine cluster protein [Aquificota bacterium]